MIGISKHRGYRLHPPDSPDAEALLTERGLSRADLDRAIAELARTEDIAIRTIVGINDDGVFGSRREGWRPRPARCLRRAVHPAPLAPGARAARTRPQRQHGELSQGRHPARLTVNARRYAALPLGLRPDRCMACSGCAGGTGMVSTLAAGNGSRGRSPRPAALPRPLIGLRD